jgi:uncharacterized protein involved in exopolysaccharide biosynthesis
MDDLSSAMSISARRQPPGQARVLAWQTARPVLIYDPALSQPTPAQPGSSDTGFFARAPVIWLTALTLGAVVGGTFALVNPQSYSATALLLGVGADEARAQDERIIIRSDAVVRGIVDRLGVAHLAPDCVGAGDSALCAARVVKGQMQAQIVDDANGIETGPMLRLTATHGDPAIAIAMLDAAVAIDRKIWHGAHVAERVDALDPQLAAAQSALDATQAEVARIRMDARVTNIAQDLAQAAADTAMLTRTDGELRLRQAAAGGELDAAQNTVRAAPETVLDSREVSAGDPGQDAQTLLLQLQLQRTHLAQLYAKDYPGLAELDHKIEAVETAMQAQAKSKKSVVRDVRNPVLALLGGKMATLGAEAAGLVQQRQELQRQLSAATTREVALRDAERKLAALQQRQGAQEATFRQLTLSVANLRAKDALYGEHLSQRRLLQRPEAVVIPWTGLQAAAVIGAATGLIIGFGLSLLAWRRRSLRRVVQISRLALERLESVWTEPVPRAMAQPMMPQVMAVPLPPSFGTPAPASVAVAVAEHDFVGASLEGVVPTSAPEHVPDHAAHRRMLAFRRERDIRSLVLHGQQPGVPAKAG